MNSEINLNLEEENWFEANRKYLVTHIEYLKYLLHISWPENNHEKDIKVINQFHESLNQQNKKKPGFSAIDHLCGIFGLTMFEKFTLLIAVVQEFDSSFLKRKEEADLTPNFSLALAILPFPEWNAFLPSSTLRKWGLLKLNNEHSITSTRISAPESIVHYIAGVDSEDSQIQKVSDILISENKMLSKENHNLIEEICKLWKNSEKNKRNNEIYFSFTGECQEIKRELAAHLSQALDFNLRCMSSVFLPNNLDEMHDFITTWERESLLHNYLILIEFDESGEPSAEKEKMLCFFIDKLSWPVLINTENKLRFTRKDQFALEVNKPNTKEQRHYWESLLKEKKISQEIMEVSSHFDLNFQDIQMCFSKYRSSKEKNLWKICRQYTKVKMDSLAQKIEPSQGALDLVLPEREKQNLLEIVQHVKLRSKVYQDWGLLKHSSRNQGISVLFSGASGTGKTTAAEYLALSLDLDLYRIDLSCIVSKYIGETEKNLQKIFAAAEKSGAILLFDEADALFGKRTQVKDSNDRHANVEVSYLLQRMETFKGVAILTSNFRDSLDKAFLRRLRFVIQFPFPSQIEREQIWEHMLPKKAPTQNINFSLLGQLNVAGGNIRNITMNACFAAAANDEKLQMKHYLKATRNEYMKLEKNLSEMEVRDWL